MGSNSGECTDVCKCLVPSGHDATRNQGYPTRGPPPRPARSFGLDTPALNSRQAARPLVRLVEAEDKWDAPDNPQGCSRPKPTTGVHLAPCHDEFRGPRSDCVRQVALETATKDIPDRRFVCGIRVVIVTISWLAVFMSNSGFKF
ncbi:hypothetical protein TNCV_1525621 [Trichonephila clavipes]|nr:hypothetical protein TNCV_1525621 [Trichonephila clavipes]